jgi:hypothetical protein
MAYQVATKQNPTMGTANLPESPKPKKRSKQAISAAKQTLLGIPSR